MHIGFVCLPLHGHLNPNLEVVRELIGRGHQVTFPTTGEHHELVAGTGAKVFEIESSMDPLIEMPERQRWMTFMREAMLAEAAHVLPQLLAGFAGEPLDLLVRDRAAFSGRMLAAKLAVPNVQVVTSFAANAHWDVTRRFAPVDTAAPEFATYRDRLEALLASHDLAWEALPAPSRQVIYLPREFQYEAETFDDHFVFAGPCLRPATSDWKPPRDDRPIMLISMGTINNAPPDLYRTFLEAFGDSPWHVVMSVGRRQSIAALGPLPANFEVATFVPQLDVLSHASMFITHAGMGSIMEALAFGVPLVQVPTQPEQEANSHRVVELGLGAEVRLAEITVPALRAAVDLVAGSPSYASKVQRMREHVLGAGGATVAADVIENAVGPR